MKKTLSRLALLVGLAGVWGITQAAGSVYATYTVNVASVKLQDKFQGCTTAAPIMPDSVVIIYYDDNTFEETDVIQGTPVIRYGTWGPIDDSGKLRTDYTGNLGERSLSWAVMLTSLEYVAGASCGVPVNADGATFLAKKQDVTIKVAQGFCSGTATSSFSMEGYGIHTGTGLPIKMSRKVTSSGTLVYGPAAGC